MVKYRANIWNYDSTGTPNIGTKFRHLMVVATAPPKVGSNQHKNFNIAKFQFKKNINI